MIQYFDKITTHHSYERSQDQNRFANQFNLIAHGSRNKHMEKQCSQRFNNTLGKSNNNFDGLIGHKYTASRDNSLELRPARRTPSNANIGNGNFLEHNTAPKLNEATHSRMSSANSFRSSCMNLWTHNNVPASQRFKI